VIFLEALPSYYNEQIKDFQYVSEWMHH
jgi:hypothetical protein